MIEDEEDEDYVSEEGGEEDLEGEPEDSPQFETPLRYPEVEPNAS